MDPDSREREQQDAAEYHIVRNRAVRKSGRPKVPRPVIGWRGGVVELQARDAIAFAEQRLELKSPSGEEHLSSPSWSSGVVGMQERSELARRKEKYDTIALQDKSGSTACPGTSDRRLITNWGAVNEYTDGSSNYLGSGCAAKLFTSDRPARLSCDADNCLSGTTDSCKAIAGDGECKAYLTTDKTKDLVQKLVQAPPCPDCPNGPSSGPGSGNGGGKHGWEYWTSVAAVVAVLALLFGLFGWGIYRDAIKPAMAKKTPASVRPNASSPMASAR